ncbi:histidine phosphatase family protein [Loigolactobacillus binensis]|uniref:Histidine phosphatase family protein n=1 Tax=Loigolactobacillus binensis TaxID=2559922 RepID=A0ABW3EGM5_9LACO|nr:histidine phosphatase family protein [Loigolactobacillus binensis]
MTEFFFIRHGQTITNQEGRINGAHIDTPLTTAGISGAQAAGKVLQQVHFNQVFVSPQKRAQKTAQLVLANNMTKKLQIVDLLQELNFGDWEGRLIADGKLDPAVSRFFNDPENYDPSSFHGETFSEVVARGQHFLQQVMTKFPTQRVLVVGHGTMLTLMIRSALGASIGEIMTQPKLSNDSISVMRGGIDTDFVLERWNDTSFLPAMTKAADY